MSEQNEGPATARGRWSAAPNRDSTPIEREVDGEVAVLTMQHPPHNFTGIAPATAGADRRNQAAIPEDQGATP